MRIQYDGEAKAAKRISQQVGWLVRLIPPRSSQQYGVPLSIEARLTDDLLSDSERRAVPVAFVDLIGVNDGAVSCPGQQTADRGGDFRREACLQDFGIEDNAADLAAELTQSATKLLQYTAPELINLSFGLTTEAPGSDENDRGGIAEAGLLRQSNFRVLHR